MNNIIHPKFFSVFKEQNEQLCTICFTNFNEGEKYVITECKHSFHIECLTRWINESETLRIKKCCLCRKDMSNLVNPLQVNLNLLSKIPETLNYSHHEYFHTTIKELKKIAEKYDIKLKSNWTKMYIIYRLFDYEKKYFRKESISEGNLNIN